MNPLRVEDVSRTAIPGVERPALDGVSLTVEPGELVLLAGGSGSGKSTLLRAAPGSCRTSMAGRSRGRVETGGLDTREHGPARLAAVAGTLFQDPETQVVMGTVRSELAFPLENLGWAAPAVARGVEEAALALGLGGLLDRLDARASGGELQRVALAASLAGRPRLLLLDEPTSQLDPVAGDELLGVLRRLNEEWGTAIVLAEHRLERCLPAADRVIELVDGRIVADETAAHLAGPDPRDTGREAVRARGPADAPVTVKEARARAGARGVDAGCGRRAATRRAAAARRGGDPTRGLAGGGVRRGSRLARRRARRDAPLAVEDVWVELREGPPVLQGVTLHAHARRGDRADGPQRRGQVDAAEGDRRADRADARARSGRRRTALLTQHPGDHLMHETIGADVPGSEFAARHPRDVSGGERQRSALELVLAADAELLLLDEPTRGMDPARRDALAERLTRRAGVDDGRHPRRRVRGGVRDPRRPARRRPAGRRRHAAEVLAGGWYFATQVARVLGGAGGALTPEQGARLIAAREPVAT